MGINKPMRPIVVEKPVIRFHSETFNTEVNKAELIKLVEIKLDKTGLLLITYMENQILRIPEFECFSL